MSKQQYADDDFEIIKGVRVLKDKRSITVGLAMMDSMDSMQRAIANNGNRKSRIDGRLVRPTSIAQTWPSHVCGYRAGHVFLRQLRQTNLA